MHQNRIDALIKEKTHARDQCDQMAAAQTNAQKEIGQLQAHNEQLQKENESLRKELLAVRATPRLAGPPSVSSESSTHSRLADQERIRQLTADANRIRGEREALRKDNEKLKAANAEWRADARREKLRNDTTIDSYGIGCRRRRTNSSSLRNSLQVVCPPTVRWGAINPACLPLRDEHLSPPRLRKHWDLLLCHLLPVNLPIWEPLAPHRLLNSRPNARPARRHRDLSTRRKTWSQTPRPGLGPGDSESPKRVRG